MFEHLLGRDQSVLHGVTHCYANHPVDPTGHHFVVRACGSPASFSERTGAYRNVRHDRVRDTYIRQIAWCGLQPVREPDMLPGLPVDRRADILIRDYPTLGVHTALDVACGAVFTGLGMLASSPNAPPGHVALQHENRKIAAYADLRPPFKLVPLIHEQFGRMGCRANSFMVDLAVFKSARLLHATPSRVKSHPLFARTFNPILTKWRRDLSLALAMENANCILKGRQNALGRYRGSTMSDEAHELENEWYDHYVSEHACSCADVTGAGLAA